MVPPMTAQFPAHLDSEGKMFLAPKEAQKVQMSLCHASLSKRKNGREEESLRELKRAFRALALVLVF